MTKITKTTKAAAKATTIKPPVPNARQTIPEHKLSAAEQHLQRVYEGSMLMRTLAFMLTLKRPYEGAGEFNALGWLLINHPPKAKWYFDHTGNLHFNQRSEKHHRTLFVAHVDTVHHTDGPNKVIMTDSVWYANGSQLGADDGAGVAMLMHMAHSGVPGHYVFTRGEECGGGVGAKALAENASFLSQFDRAIAFDRRGTTSVISHQGYGRCCSDEFAEALSAALSTDTLMYMPDDTGVYTDTAEFTDIIPECTNISIGYQREHSHEEALSVTHLRALAEVCVSLAWDDLPTVRDPNAVEEPAWYRAFISGGKHTPQDDPSNFDSKSYLEEEEKMLCDAFKDYVKDADITELRYQLASHLWYDRADRTQKEYKPYTDLAKELLSFMDHELADDSAALLQVGYTADDVLARMTVELKSRKEAYAPKPVQAPEQSSEQTPPSGS